jgi:hypothetical protein
MIAAWLTVVDERLKPRGALLALLGFSWSLLASHGLSPLLRVQGDIGLGNYS